MAVIFNQSSVEVESNRDGVAVKQLITPDRVKSDKVRSEQIHLDPGSQTDFSVNTSDLSWAHVLEGTAEVITAAGAQTVTADHFLFLPPGLSAQVRSEDGATIFRATVPNAKRFDDNWDANALDFRCTDWTEEPVLDSEFDARQRIYLITPKLSDTRAAKGEMIIYPPGTEAANHHHEGAEHFQVILKGSATFHLNEQPQKVRAGDTVYIYDNERHFLINDDDEDLVFIEYFVPGNYKTVWAPGAPVCTWSPTGKNIKGGKPSREIGAHSSPEAHERSDV